MPKGVEKLHATCPKVHFAGKLLIEILSLYIFFRTLREVTLVLRRKIDSNVGENALRASRTFFQEKQILCTKIQLQTIFRLYTKSVRKNEKNYLTGVSNLQSTCPDDRSDEKRNFFLQESPYKFSSFDKRFSKRLINFSQWGCQTAFHVPKGSFF